MILSKVTSRPMFKATYLKTRKISNIQTKMHLWLNLAHLNLMQQQHSKLSSLVLLAAQPGQLVGNNNIKLGCSLHNLFPLPGGHIVCNLSTVSPEQQLKSKTQNHVISKQSLWDFNRNCVIRDEGSSLFTCCASSTVQALEHCAQQISWNH